MNVTYVITADKPQDVLDALKKELKRWRDAAQARQPGTSGIKKNAVLASEVSTLDAVLRMLDRTAIEGELARYALEPPRWGYEAAFEQAVRLLADTPLSSETPGCHRDELGDGVISVARKFREIEEKTHAT
jgi:hypothetical protein